MEKNLLKSILCSYEDGFKDIEKTKDFQDLQNDDDELPISDKILTSLSDSLTYLLTHKVSKEAYQRYSVRENVIEVLRDWCKAPKQLESLYFFTDQQHCLKFIERLVRKYCAVEVLSKCTNVGVLAQLVKVFINTMSDNDYYVDYVDKLLMRIVELESTNEVDELLCHCIDKVNKKAGFTLNLTTLEEIYKSQKYRLIEVPLINGFILKLNRPNELSSIQSIHTLNDLLQFTVESPLIFQIISSTLKELFIHFDYASVFLDFIQDVLKRIEFFCKKKRKKIVNLYPIKLQFCIYLLRIDPSNQTSETKKYILEVLDEIFSNNEDDALILLLHFPVWLSDFVEFVQNKLSVE